MSNPSYPFDSSGSLSTNKISNEIHSVTVSNGVNAFLLVPFAAPFYGNSFSVVNSSGNTLIENVDYYLTHHWQQASNSTGMPVYGSITFLINYPIGVYKLNYQTIGGEYVSSPANAIQSGLVSIANEYVTIDWDTTPTAFPATPHTEELSGITGMSEIYHSLFSIGQAIRAPTTGVHYDDIKDMTNTYAVTVAQPLLEVIDSTAVVNDKVGELLTTLMGVMEPLQSLDLVPSTLQNYDIPLPGGFKLKIGKIIFPRYGEPSRINFPGDPFKFQCLHTSCSIAFKDKPNLITYDKVYSGAPTISDMGITIDYETANFTIPWLAAGQGIALTGNKQECVVLADGRILMTGGKVSGSDTATCYISKLVGNNVTTVLTTPLPGNIGRDHKLALLPDGRILMTGGYASFASTPGPADTTWLGTVSNNAVTWVAATALPTVVMAHQLTVLADGRVVNLGGRNATVPLNTVYFGTITNNTIVWASGSILPVAVASHQATILLDGRLFLAGGDLSTGVFTTATYFGTISGSAIAWVAGTALPVAIAEQKTVLLPDGRLLYGGGTIGSYVTATYFGTIINNVVTWVHGTPLPLSLGQLPLLLLKDKRLFLTDTVGNYFLAKIPFNDYDDTVVISNTVVSSPLPNAVNGHTTLVLVDGRILSTGGQINNTAVTTSNTYFGTKMGNSVNWVAGTALPLALSGHQLTLLPDGRIFLSGGFINTDGASSTNTDVTYFGTINGTIITWVPANALPTALRNHKVLLLAYNLTGVFPDNRILLTGGVNSSNVAGLVTFFGTITNNTVQWVEGTPMPLAQSQGTLLQLLDGRILMTGGKTNSLQAINNLYFGTITNNVIAWSSKLSLPSVSYGHTVTVLADNTVLLTGGTVDAITGTSLVYFGTITGASITWQVSNQLPITLYGHSANLLSTGQILITGGTTGATKTINNTYIVSIQYLFENTNTRLLTFMAIGI